MGKAAAAMVWLWSLALLLVVLQMCLVQAHVGHDHGGGGEDGDAGAAVAEGDRDLRRKGLVLVKVYAVIIVFFATFIPGISPQFFRWDESFLVLGTQFAGGVFLGVSVIHFLPDSDATFKLHSEKTYPFAFMLVCVGFLITMLADALIQSVYGRSDRKEQSAGSDLESSKGSEGKADTGGPNEWKAEEDHFKPTRGLAAVPKASYGDAILLIFALCFHSVFEGIAIGIAPTEKEAWKALWTVSLHKVFAAIAMAIALLRVLPERPFLACASYAFAFAISSPIGVAVGIIINASTQGATADWIYAISMGLATGIFIYVAINHLLAKGYRPDGRIAADDPFLKVLAATLGVAVVSVVLIWD